MKENCLSNAQIMQCKAQLLAEKQDLEHRLFHEDEQGLAISQREHTQELSMIDNHPADTATDLAERTKDIALLQHEELHLEQINEALVRIQNGTYGACATCHKPIDYERLLAIPTTHLCKEHMHAQPLLDRRPIEEQLLTPAFGRTSLDEREDETEFDGEDAWQIVESWGNSDSPAMSEQHDVTSYEQVYVESDEQVGFVEPLESFIATDIHGQHVHFVRNKAYREYMRRGEGVRSLESDAAQESDA